MFVIVTIWLEVKPSQISPVLIFGDKDVHDIDEVSGKGWLLDTS